MAVNINNKVMDQFYRYKMPKLMAKVEGKGNGIKTVIVNMVEVSKSLCRPPTYPTKYFGCELGAQTQWDPKNERYIVNGAHDCSKLAELLQGFIRKFVLCPNCDNPETDLIVSNKKQIISQKCAACGHVGMVDMRHKLTTFILKNPPDMDPNYTPSKKDKKSGKRKEKGRSSPDADNENGLDELIEAPPLNTNANDEEDDADWGDMNPEDIMASSDLTAAAKNLTMDDDLEKSSGERMGMFYDFVKKRISENNLVDKEISAEAERLEVKDKAVMVLVELLLSNNILKDKELDKHRILFLRFTHGNPKSQKYLLGGFEQLVGVKYHDELLAKVPLILKQLYDLDIVEEDVIIDWGTKVSKKYVSKQIAQEIHDKAAPLLKWLQEAEEEEDDDDDEEDDDGEDGLQVVYSQTAPDHVKTVTVKTADTPIQPPPAADDDDLDIDDI